MSYAPRLKDSADGGFERYRLSRAGEDASKQPAGEDARQTARHQSASDGAENCEAWISCPGMGVCRYISIASYRDVGALGRWKRNDRPRPACSARVTVETQDGHDNRSAVAQAVDVALSATPSAGFDFYSDATCSQTTALLTIAASASSAFFHFRSTTTGVVTIEARPSAASGLAPGSQNEPIVP